MTKLYGIKNCDTVRKARKWLEHEAVAHEFCDFREDPVNAERLSRWHSAVGDSLLNKRSTTWKQLSESQRSATSSAELVALLAEHPTLIKRPVLEHDDQVLIGFSAQHYSEIFQTQ